MIMGLVVKDFRRMFYFNCDHLDYVALLTFTWVMVWIKEKCICVGGVVWVYVMRWKWLNGCQLGINMGV